jgi:hypothetical protein
MAAVLIFVVAMGIVVLQTIAESATAHPQPVVDESWTLTNTLRCRSPLPLPVQDAPTSKGTWITATLDGFYSLTSVGGVLTSTDAAFNLVWTPVFTDTVAASVESVNPFGKKPGMPMSQQCVALVYSLPPDSPRGPVLQGSLVFANVSSVVSERNNICPEDISITLRQAQLPEAERNSVQAWMAARTNAATWKAAPDQYEPGCHPEKAVSIPRGMVEITGQKLTIMACPNLDGTTPDPKESGYAYYTSSFLIGAQPRCVEPVAKLFVGGEQ